MFRFFIGVLCSIIVFSFTTRLVVADDDKKIDVLLEGVPKDYSATLVSGLSIVRHSTSDRLSDKRIKQLDEASSDELVSMLKVYGYYHATVTSQIQRQEKQWQATYRVNLGEQVHISAVDLTIEGEAKQDEAFQTLMADFPLKVGDGFNHENYEAAKKQLVRLGMSRGYFDNQLQDHKVAVNTDTNTARITITWQSGIRYRLDTLKFPDTVINQAAIDRIVSLKGGEYYLASDVINLRNVLNESDYFKSVAVTTLIEQRHDGVVPVSIVIEPEKKHKYTAGIGFGTDSGVRASAGWENRYVNKRGHRLQTQAHASEIRNSLMVDYNIPLGLKKISEFGFNSGYQTILTDSRESTSQTLGGYYKRQRWGWQEKGSLRLLNEQFKVGDIEDSSLLFIPSIIWSKTWAEDTLYTRHGSRLSVELSGASDALLSDVSFLQAVIRGKHIESPTEKGRLITRSTIGVTETNEFSQLPSSLRFFSGGDTTIRGFDYEALGPRDAEGDVEGGNYLFVGSVEYEHMFYGNWGGAVFTDFGNAFNEWSDPIAYGAGVGLRWRSPIGLVRVDVASGLSDPKNPLRLHIVIGPDL